MSNSNPTVLVIGATGRFAGLVVPALAERGARVRALIRDPAKANTVRERGASEIAIGDLRDKQSLASAMHGIDGVFHIGPAFEPDEAELGVTLVNVAKAAGVRKFVFSSVIQPTNSQLPNHVSKIPVESALFASGMEYTILHPANFFQNIEAAWRSVITNGVFAEPFPTTVRIARVDYRDVADVAAIALVEDRLTYGTFELCSADRLSREEIVTLMSEALGRRIEAAAPSFEAWAENAQLPYEGEQLRLLANVHSHYAAHGLGGNDLTLRAILGHPPRSLRIYIEELALRFVA
ncbi:epimerase [Litchfieldella anticariensis FP35 = DSM 16096]|uniref:Epimerase n=1 Tax=Litchfieldella anticariensis (strain DSM 16096 / CECT 5854 / CIP 108499 / LMG 22089 / FP35) TaxID=1121939 RepID=S2L1I8_LITA3|nr:NmrA/HSCARG family protein [Halomonas anticariensis]EPC01519.1 epimerase [Halomonas anticariensis FP35 = DSM 16096]